MPPDHAPDHAPAPNNGDNNSAVAAGPAASEAVVPDAAPSNSIVAATNNMDSSSPPANNDGMAQHHHSTVNGLGMWSAWERNFTNKVKACLDLVDNAVDAALWDSDDEEEDDDDDADAADDDDGADKKKNDDEDKKQSIKKAPLTREDKWKKHTGNIQITTERHRLAMASAAAAGGVGSDNSDDDDDNSPPVIVHELAGNNGDGSNSDNDIDDYDYILDDDNTLCLHNDCVRPVKELKSILDVYNSSKTDSAIGENGVGVKQAAAAMSDLSIVVTTRIDQEPLLEKIKQHGYDDDDDNMKTNGNNDITDEKDSSVRKCVVSIGVLSKELQTNKSIVIPNWTIEVEFRVDDEQQNKEDGSNKNDVDFSGEDCLSVLMKQIGTVTAEYPTMGKAMKQFGVAVKKNQRMHGIRRLAKHVEIMISSKYSKSKKGKKNQQKLPPHPYQFLMILHRFGKHQLKKSNKNKTNNDQSDDIAIKAKNALDDLLRDLAEELPKTYLHIPPAPYFKIKVNSETLKFQYWERQLVELHKIPLVIDRKNDFRSAPDWVMPESEDDTYEIQVTIGFDPTRANPLRGQRQSSENTFIGGQACSLLIYSRVSGRLFLKHDDARGVLRLNNSGTHYCQGLTIIVDDYEGNLPLTPTKESLAFGLEDHGAIHERNLYAWLGALAVTYWTHFYNKYKTKGALGEAIKSKVGRVKELGREDGAILPTLKDGQFSTVQKVGFRRGEQGSIRPYTSVDTEWLQGPDSLIKFGAPARPKPKKLPKSSTTTAKEKRKLKTSLSVMDGYDSDGNDLMTGMPPPEGTITSPGRERLDGRPVRSSGKPQRFDEIHDIPIPRKKRLKTSGSQGKGSDNGSDEGLKKKLNEVQMELNETKAELNASKATSDDLQMLLEEREQSGNVERRKLFQLTNELNQTGEKHKAELQRIRTEHEEKVNELRKRVVQLEGRNSTSNIDNTDTESSLQNQVMEIEAATTPPASTTAANPDRSSFVL